MVLLHEAVSQNSIQEVQRLIDSGIDVNEETLNFEGTALHIAAYKGYERIARVLILNGANIEAKRDSGLTPLHLATQQKNFNIIKLLLGHKAKINETSNKLETALHIAAREGYDDLAEFLIFHGAETDIKNKDGYTPLHFAMKYPKIVNLLLKHGAKLDETTNCQDTVLHLAVLNGCEGVAEILLSRNASVNAKDINGFTPLHLASKENKINIVSLLLQNGAKINETTRALEMPLHIAAKNGHTEIVQTLISNGAPINSRNRHGFTPLYHSVKVYLEGEQLERERKAPLVYGLQDTKISTHRLIQIVEVLLKNSADINTLYATSPYITTQETLLHMAVGKCNFNMVQLLMDYGANINAKGTDPHECTPLLKAVNLNNTNIVEILLQNGANLKYSDGHTVVHRAIRWEDSRVIPILLANCDLKKIKDKFGRTPLEYSMDLRKIKITKQILYNEFLE